MKALLLLIASLFASAAWAQEPLPSWSPDRTVGRHYFVITETATGDDQEDMRRGDIVRVFIDEDDQPLLQLMRPDGTGADSEWNGLPLRRDPQVETIWYAQIPGATAASSVEWRITIWTPQDGTPTRISGLPVDAVTKKPGSAKDPNGGWGGQNLK